MESVSANPGPYAAGKTGAPLFHAAWLFGAGILVASRIWIQPAWILVALIPAAAVCALAALRAQRVIRIPLAILWILLGAWCAEMEPNPAPAHELAALSDGLMRSVEGTVTDAGPVRAAVAGNANEPSMEAPWQRIDLHVESVEVATDASDTQVATSGGVRLTVRWPVGAPSTLGALDLQCGDRVLATVRLLPTETYHDPGVWSRTDYLLDQGITSTATVAVDRVAKIDRVRGAWFSCRVSGWQHEVTSRLLALPAAMQQMPAPLRLSEGDAIMLAAIVAGDRTYLTHNLRVGFERTGSFHMLVVSGFHLAIVAGCIFWITRRLRMPRVAATIVTITASFTYALFTGFATPVQRSLWMVTLYLLGRLIYRERNAMNTIGFAALCLLVVSPKNLLDSSLQMTLLAVVAIAGVAAPLLEGTIHPYLTATRDLRLIAIDVKLAPKLAEFRVELRMVAARLEFAANKTLAWRIFPWTVRFGIRTVELFVVSCVVELAMTLPMAVYFHRITIFALPVNLFILPLLAVLMPAALLTVVMLVVWPAAAVIPGAVAALGLHVGVGLVHIFGSMALGDFRIPGPLVWQVFLFCGLLGAAMVLARRRKWGTLAASVAMTLAAFVVVFPRPVDRPRGAMLVEAIDVGQGDSILVITPDGKTLLLDGGGLGGVPWQVSSSASEDPSNENTTAQEFDIGEEVVSPALWARGIRHLDVVALSHAHSDHIGGLGAVLRNFHPDELWVGNNPPGGAYTALLNEAARLHVQVRSFRAGDGFRFGDAQVEVLAPFRDYQPGSTATNNDSLVLHVAYGGTSVMLEGDAEAPVERGMLAEPGLQSTLLKVGHHGSMTSTRPEFLARVAPQCAVISCGLHNHYGHPREEVLEELQAAQVKTFRTDLNGASCFALDGKSAKPEGCDGR